MVTKHQVYALHVEHPDWTAPAIASQLGCHSAYVRSTARRNGWSLPSAKAAARPTWLRRAVSQLLAAAREGLICAEADIEAQRRSNEEHGEDNSADPILAVFIQRRDLIAAAIADAESR